MPHVSVCIRTRDRPRELGTAIASVLAGSYQDLEIVVADDGRLGEAVVRVVGDPRVRYHANEAPRGPTANIRAAVSRARGELIAVLDDDDRWQPGFLEAVVATFRDHPDAGLVFTDHLVSIGGRLVPAPTATATAGPQADMLRLLMDRSIALNAVVMRRAVWEQGERDVPLPEFGIGDVTMWLRAAQAGWTFVRVPEPLAVVGWHPRQMSWTDPALPARRAATLRRFTFADPAAEAMRRRRLAEAAWEQAGAELRAGHPRAALSAARRGRATTPGRIGPREMIALAGVRAPVARCLGRYPGAFAASAAIWQRLRPDVARR